MTTDTSDVHCRKALASMLVNEDGIATDDVEGQPKKDTYAFTDDGIAEKGTCVSWKALLEILVTLVGIVTEVSDVHPENAM